MPHSVQYDATKHGIHSVSVFQAERAEVNRRIQVELKEGQNEVEIINLPNCLDQDSIRVDGIGHAVIFDVVYTPPPPIDSDRHGEALRELKNRRSALEAEWKIIGRQEHVLTHYSKSLEGKDSSTDQVLNFLDVYEDRQRKLNTARAALTENFRQVDDEIRKTQISLNADEESLERAVNIAIIVLADRDGPAELSLTYMVSHAWWRPIYDVRVAIARDSKSSSTVRLQYRASVSQSTGEDWSNVVLTLSTASPLQSSAIPSLQPEWITLSSWPNAVSRRSRSRSWSWSRTPLPIQPIIIPRPSPSQSVDEFDLAPPPAMTNAPTGVNINASAPPPEFFAMQDSTTSQSAVSATFTITGLSSIPSNTKKTSQTHKVSIAKFELSTVELEWVTVPKEMPTVFLQCRVQNTSNYVLLPGQTSIFMDNSFVSKATISHVSPNESFSCSLGVDPAVRVTYHPQTKKSKSTGSAILASKSTGTAFRQRTTIKNTRSTTLHKLILTDQVPVSDDSRIKVNILEPKDLQAKGGRESVISKGVIARWVQKNANAQTIEQGGGEAGLGLIEWICEIDPGASVDIELAWEVTSPAGIEWVKR